MKFKILLLVLTAVIAQSGVGEESAAEAPARAPAPVPAASEVAMKMDVVAWGDTIEGLSVKAGTKEIAVTALSFQYSKAINYSGSSIMEISQAPGGAAANLYATPAAAKPQAALSDLKTPPTEFEKRKKENPNLVALAYLPPGSRRVTVLIAPTGNATYQTYVIDDDPTKLPPGRLRIHNYSPLPVALRCNRKETVELKPKQTAVVSPVDQNVIYELAYEKNGKWKMQENNAIQVQDKEQVQLVVLKSDANFFTSGDGSRSGFLQTVLLRRNPSQQAAAEAEEQSAR
jgi:hypothetical protein